MAGNEIAQILDSLADRFCARRDLYCLFRFLPAYFAPNGLTDGWEECRTALGDTRASRMLAQHYPFPFDSGRRLSEVTWQQSGSIYSKNRSGRPRRAEQATKAEPSLWAWAPLIVFVTIVLMLFAISAIVT